MHGCIDLVAPSRKSASDACLISTHLTRLMLRSPPATHSCSSEHEVRLLAVCTWSVGIVFTAFTLIRESAHQVFILVRNGRVLRVWSGTRIAVCFRSVRISS